MCRHPGRFAAVASVTLDVVLVLPARLRALTVQSSVAQGAAMDERGTRACFRLGDAFPGIDGVAGQWPGEPHVSLFMMCVDDPEVAEVGDRLDAVAGTSSPAASPGSNVDGVSGVR